MDVFEKVKKILCDQLDLEEEQVTEEAEVIEDLGADSLDIVDLVMTLEEEFDTEIPDEDIENLKTVGDIVKYIEDHAAYCEFSFSKSRREADIRFSPAFCLAAFFPQIQNFLLNLPREGNIIKQKSALYAFGRRRPFFAGTARGAVCIKLRRITK